MGIVNLKWLDFEENFPNEIRLLVPKRLSKTKVKKLIEALRPHQNFLGSNGNRVLVFKKG